jgi:hypothetical protein
MVPVICSMAYAAFSDVAGTPETHQAVNFQSAVVEEPQTGDNVTIGPRTYNSETLNLSIGKAAHPDAQKFSRRS